MLKGQRVLQGIDPQGHKLWSNLNRMGAILVIFVNPRYLLAQSKTHTLLCWTHFIPAALTLDSQETTPT